MEFVLGNATKILLLLFLIITFLQSGLDKVLDWKGNLSWLKGHFAKSPLGGMVPFLLGILMLIETAAALICALGLCQLLATGQQTVALYGAILSCVALLMLLFGQRMAKDYDGARTVVIYLVPAIFLVFLLQP